MISKTLVHVGVVVIGPELDILIVGHHIAHHQNDKAVKRRHNEIDKPHAHGHADNNSENNTYHSSPGISKPDTYHEDEYDEQQRTPDEDISAFGKRESNKEQRQEHGNNRGIIHRVIVKAAH